MSAPEGAAPVIRSGPRWDDVLAAVDVAEAALESPLTDEELEGGWSDEGRTTVLADVRRVRDELVVRTDTSAVLADWRGIDPVDGDELRLEPILDVDLALGELERAELAISAAAAMLEDLAGACSSSDRDAGFDEAARDQLRSMVEAAHTLLAAGEYLTADLMDAWADALRAHGFIREPQPGQRHDVGEGFGGTKIQQFPPGRRWERLAIFDGRLFPVALTDTLALFEPEDRDEDPDGDVTA